MVNQTPNAPPQIVGIGEILWDMLPEGRRIGGAPANFAFHANKQGIAAAVVSAVGDDTLGREILASLAAWQMDAHYLYVHSGYPTGTVEVRLDAEGVPGYVIHEHVAWDHLPWSDDLAALAPSVQAVCFGTLGQRSPESRATIRQFVQATSPTCLRVCDINLRQSYFDAAILHDSLELATVLKLNHEELPVIAGAFGLSGSPQALLTELRARYQLDLIALTRGPAGSLLLNAQGFSDHPGYPVTVIDTVGAGDAFTASLVVGLLRGDALALLNANANRAAASACQQAGAIPAS